MTTKSFSGGDEQLGEHFVLARQQQSRRARQQLGDPFGARVCPVRCAERVTDEHVGVLGELFRQCRVVFGLSRVETGVL